MTADGVRAAAHNPTVVEGRQAGCQAEVSARSWSALAVSGAKMYWKSPKESPAPVKDTGVGSTYQNGVLELVFERARAEEAKPLQIQF